MITGALPYKCDVDLLIGIFDLNPITRRPVSVCSRSYSTCKENRIPTQYDNIFFFCFTYIYSFLYG